MQHFVGVMRPTKDADVIVRPPDRDRALQALADEGYRVEGVFHWIGKAYCGEDCVDVISGSMNSATTVDDEWFEHAIAAEVVGLPVKLCAPEELIWTKAFVMERERYDGADVAHLLRACGRSLNWARLLKRFGPHWRVLISHLILYGFIYPGERSSVPNWVMSKLLGYLRDEMNVFPQPDHLCQGTLLSWRQYLVDVEQWGYRDARVTQGYMTAQEVERWTDAFRDR